MANNSGLQYTFYFPTTKDKARWKRLSRGYTLNKWIYMQVEKSLEKEAASTVAADNDDTINQLRKQNELLTARLQQALSELADLHKGSPPTMDKDVVDILKSGGVWTSENLFKKLSLSRFADNVKKINDGTMDNTPIDPKSIERTLDTLQDFNLVQNTWCGFKWIK
jgi:hypothetical protein